MTTRLLPLRTTLRFAASGLLSARRISAAARSASEYDILNSEERVSRLALGEEDGMGFRTSVTAYGERSFVVNNVYVSQPVLLLPNSFLLWEGVHSPEEVSVHSLRVFSLLSPAIEILFLGVGETPSLATLRSPRLQAVREYFRVRGVQVEVLSTVNAASTFNVLNTEGRHVGAALLTLQPLPPAQDNSDVANL